MTNPTSTVTTPAPRAGRREWTALGVLMLPLLLVSMDVSVLYFAIPAISADLEPSGTQQLWIFDIYAFVLAGLLMTMGSLGDRIGRRRLLLTGAAAFGAASLIAAYADSAETLIAARAVLGIGGATLMPSTMALIRTMFTDPGQRAKAIGLWSGVMTGGIALGSVMSGVLVEYFWWGSVFLVNLPAMALLLVLGPVLLPESRDPAPGRFDRPSVPLSMAAVLPVIYGLKEMATEGWHAEYVLSVTVGLLFAALFVHRQRTAAAPMISPALFRRPGFAPAVVLNLVSSFGMLGSAFFTTQYLQSVLGKSALEAALWALLPSVPIGMAAPLATSLVHKGVDRAHVVTAGFATGAAGYGLLALAGTDSMWLVLSACGVLASGIVMVLSQMTDLAMSSAPVERAGSASSLLETGTEFGGALGMAVLGSIGTALYRHDMPSSAPAEARETLGGALAVAGHLPGRTGDALATAAREAFTHGMQGAAIAGAVVLAGAAAAATTTLRRTRVGDK
ncbi:DHA2 family multidrug resistance protein-like MFS transporter [Streptomyces achromogenes]|uniref:DHA2 family multidrug resistance protein-like MFS transporter n=1 Tax=Streptomyces achromogenes TaxID=67255 RepID=A0ABU0Q702_STRAH|nr:MFS transporter [Streptomyces achromogenes]MDQ0686449.1 DHA2 family multidrug resistance protein-like MFS transporter [Streptomyces achromogenes]MDQ0833578.1 DHA2 family multidrug resistance protein-like MFS transporter [Streptomyces achromogenes]